MRPELAWERRDLGELVDVLDSRRVPLSAKERAVRPGDVPYYGATGQVGWIDDALFDEPLVLLGEDGVQFFDRDKPKAYAIAGRAWVNNHAHVLRARIGLIDQRFLLHYLNWFDFTGFANGTTRLKLTQSAMRRIPVVLPPMDEQQRIVDILEDHLSCLDNANDNMQLASQRIDRLQKSFLWNSTHGLAGAAVTTLNQVAEVKLGRQRSPKNHLGERMIPYLRAANVDWNRLRLDDVKCMNFSEKEQVVHALQPLDILLTEASGSATEVGKSALYRNEVPGVCFQNTLLRVRCHGIDPEFMQKYLLAEAMMGRFIPQSRGVGIHHIGRQRLAHWPIEVPARSEQRAAVDRIEQETSAALRLKAQQVDCMRSTSLLRRSLRSAAFSGLLTGSASDTEVIEELSCV